MFSLWHRKRKKVETSLNDFVVVKLRREMVNTYLNKRDGNELDLIDFEEAVEELEADLTVAFNGPPPISLKAKKADLRSSNAAPHLSVYLHDCFYTTDEDGEEIEGPVRVFILRENGK